MKSVNKTKRKEYWKNFAKQYGGYIAVVVVIAIWIAVSNSGTSEPEDTEYLESLLAADLIPYESSYSGSIISYSQLSKSYTEAGYDVDVDATIILSPEDADTDGEGVLETGIADYEGTALYLDEDVDATWTFTLEEAGLYYVELDYAGVDGDGSDIQRSIYFDGELLCEESSNVRFYRYFIESGEVTVNNAGDEVWPQQSEVVKWMTQAAYDSQGYEPEPMYFYLEAGEHTLTLGYVDQVVAVKEVRLVGKQTIPTYEEVYAGYEAAGYTAASSGSGYYVEGEDSTWRNDSIIRRESNNDPQTSPSSIFYRVLNVVGGSRWGDGEQSVSWTITVEESGLYAIGIKVLQSDTAGMPVYRKITIDGEVPFQEFLEYKFEYSSDWYGETLSNSDGEPYLVYLEAGEHELTLTAQLGPIADIIERSENDINVLSELYREITKITGTDPDSNYEYDLYRLMPDLSAELTELADSLEICAEILDQISNKTTTMENNYRSIVATLRDFAEDVDSIPGSLDELENAQSSLGTYITSLDTVELAIDYLEIYSPEDEFVVTSSTALGKAYVSVVNFFMSFVKDYDSIGVNVEESEETVVLEVWIARGTEWGEILNELIESEFTPSTGIYVNLNVMPSSQLSSSGVNVLMLSINAGTAPDVAISVDYNSPSEFAFRGAVVDLTQFDDFDEVASWFYDSALIPYTYQGGVYAIPETIDFTVMFYRKDLIEELGIELPDTWEELYEDVLPVLYENSMSFSLPVDTSVSSSSPSGLRGFTMLLLQNGGTYYSEDGKSSALDTAEAYQAFVEWTNLYSQYDVDEESSLFSRMRTGQTPLGIGSYSDYITFLTSAPELYGRWGIALVPGILQEDGTIDRTTGTMSSTANIILSQSEHQEEAWEFLKWWMSEETQTSFGRQLEATIGESARWNTANKEAFYNLPWSSTDVAVIQETLDNAQEQYIVPGGYFTSRHLVNAWNSVVVNAENARDVLEQAVKDINKELQNKIEEFGLEDVDIINGNG